MVINVSSSRESDYDEKSVLSNEVYNNYITPASSSEYLIAPKTKLYKRRFFMLFLYGLSTMINGFMWIQFSILTSIVTCYYHEDVQDVNLTAVLFNIMYLPFILPVAWLLNVKGLRYTLIFGAAGNTLASCIQLLSLAPDRFYVVLICQTVASIAQVATLSVPPFIAALWFGPKEVSQACAAAAWFNQLGNALGFVIPPFLVPSKCDDKAAVHDGLQTLALLVAIFNFVIFVATVMWFEDRPKLPPSIAEAKKVDEFKQSTVKSALQIIRNKNFVILTIVNGVVLDVFFAMSPMLNQMVIKTFAGAEIAAGWIGFETTCTGMIGAVLMGYILDKTQCFRLSSIMSNVLSLTIVLIYTVIASVKILWLHFLVFGLIGLIFMTYNTIGFQYAAELTYPEPEGTSGTILIGVLQLLGIAITMTASWLQQSYSSLHSNLFFCGCVVLSTFLSFFIKDENKRASQDRVDPNRQLVDPSNILAVN